MRNKHKSSLLVLLSENNTANKNLNINFLIYYRIRRKQIFG